MPTSIPPSLLSTETEDEKLTEEAIVYFRERLKNRLHSLVLDEFARQEEENELTRAQLARLVGMKPEQITRALGAPGNWTLNTLSDLLLGLGSELYVDVSRLGFGEESNRAPVAIVADFAPGATTDVSSGGVPSGVNKATTAS